MSNLSSKIIIGATLALAAATSAFATTQTTSPVDYSVSGWHNDLLSEINLPAGTVAITSITGSTWIADQGWGGQDEAGNQIYLSLQDDGNQIWSDHFAGGVHGGQEVNFNLSNDPAAEASLVSAMLGVSSSDALTLELRSSTIGYPGWSLSVSDAQFTAVSSVPEAGNLSMMLAGLAAITFLARRKKQA